MRMKENCSDEASAASRSGQREGVTRNSTSRRVSSASTSSMRRGDRLWMIHAPRPRLKHGDVAAVADVEETFGRHARLCARLTSSLSQ